MKILLISASLRKDSLNTKLLGVASAHLKYTSVSNEIVTLKEFRIPLYDQDLEEASGVPLGVQSVGQKIAEASGVIFSTPEYNGSIPGVFKNLIDWISRLDPHPWTGKPVALFSASPGGLGGIRALWHSRVPLEALGAHVYSQMFGLAKAHEGIPQGTEGKLVDPKMQKMMEATLDGFVDFSKKLSKSR
jgi:chromate reductase, NAD(P)H dehydrogenase (quinone)